MVINTCIRDLTLQSGNRYHLPLPTGPYQVIGFYDIMTGTDNKDGVLARILYPALDQTIKITEKYKEWPNWFPNDNYRKGIINVANIWWSPAVKLMSGLAPNVFIPILQNIEPLNDQKFPVIIFSHGLASCRTTYSDICCEMASYGFVVVVLEHRDQSACTSFMPNNITDNSSEPFKWIPYLHSKSMESHIRGRNEQLDQRVDDINNLLIQLNKLQNGEEFKNLLEPKMESQKFSNLIDLNNIIVMGHSFGSATAIRSLIAIDSIKLAVCLDSWMYPIKDMSANSVTKPILFVNMQTFQTKVNLRKMRQFISTDGKNCSTRKVITIKDGRHTDQSDIPFVLSSFITWIFRMKSKVDPFVVHDLTTALAIEFIVNTLQIKLNKDKKDFIQKYSDQLMEGIAGLD